MSLRAKRGNLAFMSLRAKRGNLVERNYIITGMKIFFFYEIATLCSQ
jgi:hypothetical protein